MPDTAQKKDDGQALYCYQQAATQGDLEGMINLAIMHLNGIGTEPNAKTAFEWIEKAAQAKSPLGQRILAEFYQNGIGTEPNEQDSFKYYISAAKQKEPVAVQYLKKKNPHLQTRQPF